MNRHVPDPAVDAIDFGEMGHSLGLLLRLAQVRVFEIFYDKLAHHGLKPGEFTVIWLIGLNPETRQGDIARRVRIKPAHMTKLIGRAVDAGLVERIVPEDDRRSVRLKLTEDGEQFVDEKKREFLTYLKHENIGLTETDFDDLIRLLRVFNGMEAAK